MESPIGYLHNLAGEPGYRLVCAAHRTHRSGKPVYRENISPYQASCVTCQQALYQAPTDIELFDGR